MLASPPVRVPIAWSAYLFGALGLFLLAVPWSGVWETAVLPLAPTAWGGWARSGWVRGFVTGLGLLNLVVAISDAARVFKGTEDSTR